MYKENDKENNKKELHFKIIKEKPKPADIIAFYIPESLYKKIDILYIRSRL